MIMKFSDIDIFHYHSFVNSLGVMQECVYLSPLFNVPFAGNGDSIGTD